MARIRGDVEDFPAYSAGRNGRPDRSTSPAAALPFAIDGIDLDTHLEAAALPTPRSAGTVAVNPVLQLIGQANDLLRLAAKLESEGVVALNKGRPRRSLRAGAHPRGDSDDDLRWLDQARQAYRTRRIRGTIFGDDALFGEPAWDLLLDLFIAAKEGKRVPVTSACIGAAVPTTTALRWLAILEDRGLIVREGDPADARRVFVRLSADAYARMIAYFARAAGGEPDGTLVGETRCGGDGSAT